MAERPDLEYAVPILARELVGDAITSLRVAKPVVLRIVDRAGVDELVLGRTIESVSRRAHFVLFELGGAAPVEIVVAPMLAGRFVIAATSGAKPPNDLAVGFGLRSGRELLYRDDVQMGKVYVIAKGRWELVPGLAKIGIDVLAGGFTRETFREMCKKRRDQAKVFLMDKTALDAMGNAYADEVLFEANIHPKTFVRSLSIEQTDRLHDAIVRVLSNARRVIEEKKPAIDVKLRDFLKVRGRQGEPCVRCGTKLRRAGVHGHDAVFCPECQPDARGSAIVDWRRVK